MPELPLSIEERLAALEAVVNKLKAPPMDLLLQEGYLQIGSNNNEGGVRLDSNGLQFGTLGGIPGVSFVPALLPDPDDAARRGQVAGLATSGAARMEIKAITVATTGRVFILSSDTSTSTAVNLQATDNSAAVTAQVQLFMLDGATHGLFTLSDAILVLDQLDPSSLTAGRVWFGTDNILHYYDGTNTIDLTGGGGMSVIVKEADEVLTNTPALQNDDELLFAVAANEVVQFEGVLLMTSSATPDFQMTFTGPTGAVGGFSMVLNLGTTTLAGGAALGTALPVVSASFAGTPMPLRFWGGIHNGSTAGNCTLQWAQNTNSATATTVHTGSFLKYQTET